MQVGLLWYDPDPKKPSEAKIDEAAARFHERTGRTPDTCHVHPEQLVGHPRLRVTADRWVRPHSFWVGVDEDETAGTARAIA